VVYFLARKLNGKEIPQHGEVDAIKWFSIDEALETLKYDNVKDVLRKVAEDIAK
jgi:NADH pyrophosphatase NudC (nudix superfamily)